MKLKKPSFKKPDLSKVKNKFKKPDFTTARTFLKSESTDNVRLSLLLAKKELSNYFSSPLAYIVLTLFIVIVCIILFAAFSYLQFGTADLTQLFTAISFAFIIIIPALTMGSISREKQSGTIEYLLTQPITELQLLIGKFLAYAGLVAIMLLLTVPLSLMINFASTLDFGQVIMQYLGGFVLGLCFVSIGIAVSSFFKNEIASLLTSLLISVLFIITGTQFLNFFPLDLQSLINKFSLLSHFQSISRGVLDVRDVLYFAVFIIFFLAIAYYKLISEKFPSKDVYLKYSRILLAVVLVVVLLIGYFGQLIPGRLDATSNQRYTLSSATVNLLSKLEKDFNITLYESSNLPQDFQSVKRDVEDILRDYEFASNGKVKVTIKDPQTDSAAKEEATTAGIQQNIFAVASDDSTQQVVGYFGLVFKYGETADSINLTSGITTELEFQLTKKIKKVSGIDRSKIAFISNNVKQSLAGSYTALNGDLSELFNITEIALDATTKEIPADIKAVILAGPNQKFDTKPLEILMNYYKNGGSIFLLNDAMDVAPTGNPEKVTDSLSTLFADSGVKVNDDFIYDLEKNNQIQTGTGLFPVILNYPFWIISGVTNEGRAIYNNIDNLSALWASSISIDTSKVGNNKVNTLFRTSIKSNIQTLPDLKLNVDQEFKAKDTDSSRAIAVSIENEKGGRAVIISDSDFITDEVLNALQGRPGSQDSLALAFGSSTVEWLTKDISLSSIKVKNRIANKLSPDSEKTALIIGIGIIFPVVLFVSIGAFRFYMRKKESENIYEFGE